MSALMFVLDCHQRGFVFFRKQDINIADQKVLDQKLGEVAGKPATSKVNVPHVAILDQS